MRLLMAMTTALAICHTIGLGVWTDRTQHDLALP
jgi:hypothetical protein